MNNPFVYLALTAVVVSILSIGYVAIFVSLPIGLSLALIYVQILLNMVAIGRALTQLSGQPPQYPTDGG